MNVRLWQSTLASTPREVHAAPRERLRTNYEACRSAAATIAADINRDNPNYTVHDITHMDALWELADLIAGPQYSLTPLEGFIAGCAMLIHDLAMGMAAFPEPNASLVGPERWNDTVYVHLQNALGRPPTQTELRQAPSHVLEAAKAELLRELHAEQAERLTHQQFQDRAGGSVYYLIQDPDLRNMYGDIIGRIAASHGWDHKRLASEFNTKLGAPASMPREWTVDPLTLACLLRVADASHLDTRRAPGFLRAIRNVDAASRPYWIFQERLNRPWLDGDRLTYTASQPFSSEDSEAWWLCIDTLRMVDRELRLVDALLADTARARFAARSVAYVDDLERLSRFIPVRDWFPIDARIKVGDVVDLVRKMGGEQLYGDDPHAALRELISNAADAVRARRTLETPQALEEQRLHVEVQIRSEADQEWLVVRDNGIGMSREVLSGPLLDFGKSYWSSSTARRDFPGLMSSGFSPTGRFGIGFFSVFMLGDHVKVSSRRFDLGVSDTHVLIFNKGLGSRPLLRRASPRELLPSGGTEVAVAVRDISDRLFDRWHTSLSDLCSWICPTTDVNLDVVTEDGQTHQVVEADDWKSCPAAILIDRIGSRNKTFDKSVLNRLRLIGDEEIKGRAAITVSSPHQRHVRGDAPSIITVGGMHSSTYMSHIGGVFIGRTLNAARDAAAPAATSKEIATWATEQVHLVAPEELSPNQQMEFASVACTLGGEPGRLVIAEARCGFMNTEALAEWAADKEAVRLIDDSSFYLAEIPHGALDLDVLVVRSGWPGIFQQARWRSPDRHLREVERGESLEEISAKVIFRAWELPQQEAERQLKAHLDIIRAYEDGHMDDFDMDDPNYPFREEVASRSSSERVIVTVTHLTRQGMQRRAR